MKPRQTIGPFLFAILVVAPQVLAEDALSDVRAAEQKLKNLQSAIKSAQSPPTLAAVCATYSKLKKEKVAEELREICESSKTCKDSEICKSKEICKNLSADSHAKAALDNIKKACDSLPKANHPSDWQESIKRRCDPLKPCSDACKALPETSNRGGGLTRDKMRALCSIGRVRDTVERWLEARGKIAASVAVGVDGDATEGEDTEAGTDRLQIRSTINMSAGNYPNEFNAEWGAQVRYEDGTVEEDVTKVVVTYDHYFTDDLETFAFLERYTDSFLGIDQRWETGFGAEWEYKGPNINNVCRARAKKGKKKEVRCKGVTSEGEEQLRDWEILLELGFLGVAGFDTDTATSCFPCRPRDGVSKASGCGRKQIGCSQFGDDGHCKKRHNGELEAQRGALYDEFVHSIEAGKHKVLEELILAFAKVIEIGEETKTRLAIRNETATFELGVGASLLREAERFALNAQPVDGSREIIPDAELRTIEGSRTITRASYRLALRWRPTPYFELRTLIYHKDSLDRDIPASPDVNDYRVDGFLTAEFKLKDTTLFGAKPSIKITYTYRYDNAPPFVSRDQAMESSVLPLTANDTHHDYGMSLSLLW